MDGTDGEVREKDAKQGPRLLTGMKYEDEMLETMIFEELQRLVDENHEEKKVLLLYGEEVAVEGERVEWLLQQATQRARELVQRYAVNQLQEFAELVWW